MVAAVQPRGRERRKAIPIVLLAIGCAWLLRSHLNAQTADVKVGTRSDTRQMPAAGQAAGASETRRSAADSHRQQAIAFLDQGNLQQASTELRAALALDPGNAASHDYLGVILGEQGQPEAAAAAFREAIRLDGRQPEPHLHLGLALERTGSVRDALIEYREAVR